MLVIAQQLYDGLLGVLAALAAATVAAMAVMITLDVALRNTGLGSFGWLNELVEYGLYAMTFLAAPWVLRRGAHVRMDLIVTSLPPRLARAVELAADALGAVICLVLLYYSASVAHTSFERGSLIIKALIYPEWPLLAILPVCFALLAVEFITRGARTLRQKDGRTVADSRGVG